MAMIEVSNLVKIYGGDVRAVDDISFEVHEVGMVTDIHDGLLDKFLIAPIRRSSILLGKVFADATRMAIFVITRQLPR